MTNAQVLPVSVDEAEDISMIVRHADREEIYALGMDMVEALKTCFGGSMKASKIVIDGKIVAVFGDAFHDSEIGVPWLISTQHVEGRPKAFLSVCKPEVQEMLTRHRSLLNFVDVRNRAAVKWLKWLGFEFMDAIPYGPKQMLFYPFKIERKET